MPAKPRVGNEALLSAASSGPNSLKITPALVQAVADRVYARLLQEWRQERERRGAGGLHVRRPGDWL